MMLLVRRRCLSLSPNMAGLLLGSCAGGLETDSVFTASSPEPASLTGDDRTSSSQVAPVHITRSQLATDTSNAVALVAQLLGRRGLLSGGEAPEQQRCVEDGEADDEAPAVAQKFSMMNMPTVLAFQAGEAKRRIVGGILKAKLVEGIAVILG